MQRIITSHQANGRPQLWIRRKPTIESYLLQPKCLRAKPSLRELLDLARNLSKKEILRENATAFLKSYHQQKYDRVRKGEVSKIEMCRRDRNLPPPLSAPSVTPNRLHSRRNSQVPAYAAWHHRLLTLSTSITASSSLLNIERLSLSRWTWKFQWQSSNARGTGIFFQISNTVVV
jgi:hypothetical protein